MRCHSRATTAQTRRSLYTQHPCRSALLVAIGIMVIVYAVVEVVAEAIEEEGEEEGERVVVV